MKRLRDYLSCSDRRLAWIEERARFDPYMAGWVGTIKLLDAAPSVDDVLALVELYATALDQAQAAALRAAQVRPVTLEVDCAASSCELRKALEGRRPPTAEKGSPR